MSPSERERLMGVSMLADATREPPASVTKSPAEEE